MLDRSLLGPETNFADQFRTNIVAGHCHFMEPIVRAGTEHEDGDRRRLVACFIGTAPLAVLFETLMYWIA